MLTERSLIESAAKQLEGAGFLVEREMKVQLGATDRVFQADLVGFAGSEEGVLTPEVLVEVKTTLTATPMDAVLAHLSRCASVLRVRRAYLFDGTWHAVDPSFSRAVPSDTPRPAHSAKDSTLPPDQVMRLVRNRLAHAAAAQDRKGVSWEHLLESLTFSLDDAPKHSLTAFALSAPANRVAFLRAASSILHKGLLAPKLADSLVRLLHPMRDWHILDPSCGGGELLWAVAALQPTHLLRQHATGWFSSDDSGQALRQAAASSRVGIEFHRRAPDRTGHAEAFHGVLSAPSSKDTLHTPVRLSTGDETRRPDLAVLDGVEHWLRPQGRAVLLLSQATLGEAGIPGRIRDRIARTMWIRSVIELPESASQGFGERVGVVVVERSAPRHSLVARLGVDWEEQLSDSGSLMGELRSLAPGA